MPDGRFVPSDFLPDKVYSRIVNLRVSRPDAARKILAARRRRRSLAEDGKLAMLAADHPARMVTGIRDDPTRMGRRREFLARILRVLACSPFDGVLGTADVIDELALASRFSIPRRLLDSKVLVGSTNRGGVAGSSFELDDTVTGYDVAGAVASRLDGVKFLLRFDLDDPATLRTLGHCVDVLRECNSSGMPLFIEPLPVVKKDGKIKTDYDRVRLVKLVGVASGLGSSSSDVWLKLPYCVGFEEVAAATTLPILLLGGEASNDVGELLRQIESAMKAGPNVRGVMMGRNLMYPPGDDPLPLAKSVWSMVHEGSSAKQAQNQMERWVGRDLEVFGSND